MDLSKAFNCLPLDLLIAKLNAYGLSPVADKTGVKYKNLENTYKKDTLELYFRSTYLF